MTLLETDPVCLALDDDGNLIVPLRHLRGSAAVRQGINSRVRLIKGEVFWNRDAGVAWMENDIVPESRAILGQVYSESRARAEFRSAILATPGTLASSLVMSMSFDGTTRTLSCEYEVDTLFGDTVTEKITKVI